MSKAHSILVVDDDPEIMTLLSTRLNKKGYKVSTAADGHKALEVARREMPDLIVLDVMMPGKSGWEVARALKQDPNTNQIKIVMFTAMGAANAITAPIYGADAAVDKHADESFADARVDKPFEFSEVERVIAQLLG
jgi:CheY-like chemotaxis protein